MAASTHVVCMRIHIRTHRWIVRRLVLVFMLLLGRCYLEIRHLLLKVIHHLSLVRLLLMKVLLLAHLLCMLLLLQEEQKILLLLHLVLLGLSRLIVKILMRFSVSVWCELIRLRLMNLIMNCSNITQYLILLMPIRIATRHDLLRLLLPHLVLMV